MTGPRFLSLAEANVEQMFDRRDESTISNIRTAPVATLPAIARYLDCDVAELERAIEAGELRIITPSDEVRVHDSDLEAYLATHPLS